LNDEADRLPAIKEALPRQFGCWCNFRLNNYNQPHDFLHPL
jgi:hypothetical protein